MICRALKRILCLTIITLGLFLYLSVMMGGEPFRWLGQKAEQLGRLLRLKSEEVAKEADRIKEKKEVVEEVVKETEKVKRFLKEKGQGKDDRP